MESRIEPFEGKFYDGRTAAKVSVLVRPTVSSLVVAFPDNREALWAYSSLRLADSGGSKGFVRVEREVKETGSIRVETLVVSDSSFLARVEEIAPNALGSPWDQPRHSRAKRLLLALAVTVIPPLIYLLWKIVIPLAADAVVPAIPVSWEEKLGQKVFEGMFIKEPPAPSPQARKALDEITQRLLASVENQPYNFRVYIHPDKTFNAMALPGGIVVVFQGLIDKTESPEELAGVLAHEFQHVLQRHPTRNLARQVALSAVLAMIVGDTSNVMGLILEMAGQLGGLSYTRKMEAEADAKGMQMMIAAGIDPSGMIGIFEKMTEQKLLKMFDNDKNDSSKTSKPKENVKKPVDQAQQWMEYFSSHPMGKNRVKMLVELADEKSGVPIQSLLPDMDWKTMRKAPGKSATDKPGKKI